MNASTVNTQRLVDAARPSQEPVRVSAHGKAVDSSVQPGSQYDHTFAAVVFLLVGIGTVMIYSSSTVIGAAKFNSTGFFMIRHAIHLVAGLFAFAIAYRLPFDKLRSIAPVFLLVAFILLVVPLVAGPTHKGAQRWITLFGFSFQPSELAKFALIVFLADRLSRQQERLRSFTQGLLPHLAIITLALGLIVAEPDLSTAVAIALIVGVMMVAAQVRTRHLLVLAMVLGGFVAILVVAEPYRMARLTGYLSGASGSSPSYQIQQGFVAMGSGGVFGRGLGQSLQKYFFLPEPYTDSIFPIIGEEFGLFGTFGILTLFGLFGWRAIEIIRRQPTLYRFLLGVGLTANVIVYATLNMAVMTGLLPATGLPLPFISYGGTALVINLAAVGLLLNLSRDVSTNLATNGTEGPR